MTKLEKISIALPVFALLLALMAPMLGSIAYDIFHPEMKFSPYEPVKTTFPPGITGMDGKYIYGYTSAERGFIFDRQKGQVIWMTIPKE